MKQFFWIYLLIPATVFSSTISGSDACNIEPSNGNVITKYLHEKPEGYCVDTEKGPLIVQGFNKSQIDNEDTYLALIDIGGIDPLSEEVISRRPGQLLKESLRENIIERIAGSYEQSPSDNFKNNFIKDIYELSFTAETKQAQVIKPETARTRVQFADLMNINEGDLRKQLLIGEDRIKIIISLNSQNSELNEFHRIEYDFEVVPNDDWSNIKLINNKHVLNCNNTHYLKLICSDNKLHIAFSMEKEEYRKISYKIVRLVSDKIPAQIPRQFVIPHTVESSSNEALNADSNATENSNEESTSGNIQYHAEHYHGTLKRVQKD